MSKEIFIVYATHLGSVEQVYAFEIILRDKI